MIFLQDPQIGRQALLAAELNPSLLLQGETPRLINEWQLAPQLWDAVRHEVDMRGQFGQFILTGSTTPVENMAHRHSGTGRISAFIMRPMTLMESGDSSAQIALADLFQGMKQVQAISNASLEKIAFFICRGGWPKAIGMPEKIALQQAIHYVDSIINSHLVSYDGIQRNPERVRILLRSYARFVATDAKIMQIHRDIAANNTILSYDTTMSYITTLK